MRLLPEDYGPYIAGFFWRCLGRDYVIQSPNTLSVVESFGLWTQREMALLLEYVSWLPSHRQYLVSVHLALFVYRLGFF